MKDIAEIARRFFEVRKELLVLTEGKYAHDVKTLDRVCELRGRMEALAFVLDVDLALMDAPKPPSPLGPLTRVALHPVPAFGGFVVEFPAECELGWRTEEWGAFVSNRQMRGLADAMRAVGVWSRPGRGDGVVQFSRHYAEGQPTWSGDTLPPGA